MIDWNEKVTFKVHSQIVCKSIVISLKLWWMLNWYSAERMGGGEGANDEMWCLYLVYIYGRFYYKRSMMAYY